MSGAPEAAAFLAALDATQYLSTERMAAYQRRPLEVLVRHARSETAFYGERLAPLFRADGTIDWERWRELPILTRTEVQDGFAALQARTLPPAAGRTTEDSSSGSTGTPLRFRTCSLQHLAADCCSERFYRWHGLDRTRIAARIRSTGLRSAPYPDGRVIEHWRLGDENSRAIDLSISTPVDLQIEWLERVKPAYLFSYPSNLREIARVAGGRGIALSIDAIFTVGEMISDETRSIIHAYFGSDPRDRYGSSEAGQIAAGCPHSGKHHINAEVVLVEILDDAGKPVAAGTPGRIVVTPFYNLAMPLIRYDTGDHAILSAAPCDCGRTLPTLERILGRSRNMFRFVDGSSIWPVMESWRVQSFVPHRQFQVVQVAPDRIEYRYVPTRPDAPIDPAGLTAFARAMLHPTINVEAIAVEEIRPGANGKYEDYISLVAP